MRRNVLVLCVIAIAFLSPLCLADEHQDCASDINIPCIVDFHEAIEASCHKYMPAEDYATIRLHVPNIVKQASRIAALKLDSTYADVLEDFDFKRAEFLKQVTALETAADGTNDEKVRDCFNAMHTAFARMNASLVLVPSEIEEFHGIIAAVWHDYLPKKDYAAIGDAIPQMKQCCTKLMAVKLPKGKQSIQKEYISGVRQLQESVDGVAAVIEGGSENDISMAVSKLHDSYAHLRHMF